MNGKWGLALIFFTGAVVLALEVLSSRIMTPYFGVSLYIWTGILSTTLTFLAVGYFVGGRITKALALNAQMEVFLVLPVISAASITVSSAIYPIGFPYLANFDLVAGSFIASFALLALPLVCLSAMNPLLISLRGDADTRGDGGAGLVLFVSTAGSVVGVVVTAFAIIPNFTNFSALSWLALSLCAAIIVPAIRIQALGRRQRRRLIAGLLVIIIVSGGFVANHSRYLDYLAAYSDNGFRVEIVDEFSSLYGNIKIVDILPRNDGGSPIRAFIQDGIIQNRATHENVSVSMYTYVLDKLSAAFVPEARSALVLGLGAGIVPQDFARRGLDVTVVDINKNALEAATRYFGFRGNHIRTVVEDARTWVRRCESVYDVIVVDLFQGDGTPDYLLTTEFFKGLRRCMSPDGAVVMNAFLDPERTNTNRRLQATIAEAFPAIFEFDLKNANSFVVGMAGVPPADVTFSLDGIPPEIIGIVAQSMGSGKRISKEILADYEPVNDRQNVFSLLIANIQMQERRKIVALLPMRVLVN